MLSHFKQMPRGVDTDPLTTNPLPLTLTLKEKKNIKVGPTAL